MQKEYILTIRPIDSIHDKFSNLIDSIANDVLECLKRMASKTSEDGYHIDDGLLYGDGADSGVYDTIYNDHVLIDDQGDGFRVEFDELDIRGMLHLIQELSAPGICDRVIEDIIDDRNYVFTCPGCGNRSPIEEIIDMAVVREVKNINDGEFPDYVPGKDVYEDGDHKMFVCGCCGWQIYSSESDLLDDLKEKERNTGKKILFIKKEK